MILYCSFLLLLLTVLFYSAYRLMAVKWPSNNNNIALVVCQLLQ